MNITFINHSSLVIASDTTRILCDPWYDGTAFADGWKLLCDREDTIDAIEHDYLWISHEHPDHFCVKSILKCTDKKPVLFQKTKDQKVKNFMTAKGFELTEMASGEPYKAGDLEVVTIVTEGYDSCLLVTDNAGQRFLNINDSQLDRPHELDKVLPFLPIHGVAIQFHYANWAGNRGDNEIPEIKRQDAVNRVINVCQSLGCSQVLLFASFVHYCHEENFYWNDHFNLAQTMADLKAAGLDVYCPTPRDEFSLVNEKLVPSFSYDEAKAVAFWNAQHEQIEPSVFSSSVAFAEVVESYHGYLDRLHEANNFARFQETWLADFNLVVRLCDLDQCYRFYLFEKRVEECAASEAWDIELSSEAFKYILDFKFGLGSVTISSRVQFNYETAYKLYFFFVAMYKNNIGVYLENGFLSDLGYDGFRNNGVLKPIFKTNPTAEQRFQQFIDELAALEA